MEKAYKVLKSAARWHWTRYLLQSAGVAKIANGLQQLLTGVRFALKPVGHRLRPGGPRPGVDGRQRRLLGGQVADRIGLRDRRRGGSGSGSGSGSGKRWWW